MSHAKNLLIYTDGAARGNPGPGGYGIVLIWGNTQKELSGGYRLTTNNRMELMAVIVALSSLTREQLTITIYTDSKYIVDSVQKKWLQLAKQHHIQFVWVKGHAENALNNRCDELATSAADGKHLMIDEWYEKVEKGNSSTY